MDVSGGMESKVSSDSAKCTHSHLTDKVHVGTLGGAVIDFFLTPFFFIWGLLAHWLPKNQVALNTILHRCVITSDLFGKS